MIVLASGDQDVLRRWGSGVPDDAVPVHDQAELARTLDGQAGQLVLLDVALPGLGGVAGVAGLISRHSQCRVVALSHAPSEDEGFELLRAGVRGYCNAYIDPRLLGKVLATVQGGEVWVGRKLVDRLVGLVANSRAVEPKAAVAAVDLGSLTPRERQIALLIGEGASNKVIARRLDITERTVKAHLGSVFSKLGVAGRLQLALLVAGLASDDAQLSKSSN